MEGEGSRAVRREEGEGGVSGGGASASGDENRHQPDPFQLNMGFSTPAAYMRMVLEDVVGGLFSDGFQGWTFMRMIGDMQWHARFNEVHALCCQAFRSACEPGCEEVSLFFMASHQLFEALCNDQEALEAFEPAVALRHRLIGLEEEARARGEAPPVHDPGHLSFLEVNSVVLKYT